jgi:hypothetical protein
MSQYTFLPWLRRGLSRFITETETSSGANTNRHPKIVAQVAWSNNTSTSKDIYLNGPADVLGLSPDVIIRAEPKPDSNLFESDFACFVEFYDEDFPWRYTPFKPDANGRLCPWLCLVVASEDEYELINGKVNKLKITKAGVLPDPANLWATAHVQLNDAVPVSQGQTFENAVDALLKQYPDAGLSRVMSHRLLQPAVKYRAFLVPVFEHTRRSMMDLDLTNTPLNTIAWTNTTADLEIPYFHSWAFETSASAGFETAFVKLMRAGAKYGFPPDKMDVQSVYDTLHMPFRANNNSTDGTRAIPAHFAFHAYNHAYELWGQNQNPVDTALMLKLADTLNDQANANPNEDPYIDTPPIYGQHHALRTSLNATAPLQASPWLEQVNLDLGLRAVAGMAAKVVRHNDESLMALAWQQVDQVREANRKIQFAEFGAAVAQKMFDKHVASKSDEDILKLSAKVLDKVSSTGQVSVQQNISTSSLPLSAVDPGFRKMIRANGPLGKKAYKAASIDIGQSIVTKLADNVTPASQGISAAPQKKSPANLISQAQLAQTSSVWGNAFTVMDTANLNNTKADFTQISQSVSSLTTQLQPTSNLKAKLSAQVTVPNSQQIHQVGETDFPKIMAAPDIPIPAVQYLLQFFPDLLLPASNNFPANTLSLAAVNHHFVEAFMLGLNHAFAGELLWRGYPTDQKGTYFKSFWRRHGGIQPDIEPIHQWPSQSALGQHQPNHIPRPALILVVKGDLLRQYPDVVLYAQRAQFGPNGQKEMADNNASNQQYPLFAISLQDDVHIIAFDFALDEAVGDQQQAGWFFVAKERPGSLRFRLANGLNINQNDHAGTVASRLFSQPFLGAFHFNKLQKLID